jgi:hypothetical protein
MPHCNPLLRLLALARACVKWKTHSNELKPNPRGQCSVVFMHITLYYTIKASLLSVSAYQFVAWRETAHKHVSRRTARIASLTLPSAFHLLASTSTQKTLSRIACWINKQCSVHTHTHKPFRNILLRKPNSGRLFCQRCVVESQYSQCTPRDCQRERRLYLCYTLLCSLQNQQKGLEHAAKLRFLISSSPKCGPHILYNFNEHFNHKTEPYVEKIVMQIK